MKSPALPRVDFRRIADDFRNLDPKDVGAWPLAPRVVVLFALFLFILAAGWWFVWSEQLATLETRRGEELTLREQFLAKKRQAVNLDLYTRQLDEIDRAFGALLKQLPSRSEVESLLVEINQAGTARGLQFELFKPGQEVLGDFYAELPITLRLSGNYHDFGAFAGDIGGLSRIVTLSNIAIAPPAPGKEARDGAGGPLVMEAVARTYRYLDEEEVAAQKKAAQAAKAGKK